MFFVAIAFLIGHCLLHALPRLPVLSVWAVIAALAIISIALAWKRSRRTGTLLLAFALGFILAWWSASQRLAERWPESKTGTDVELDGHIASIVEQREDGARFLFDVQSANDGVPPHIELNWYDTEIAPQAGELWHLRVRLRAPHGFANPGGFDSEAQLLHENIGATGYVRDSESNRRLSRARGYLLLRTRAWIAQQLAAAIPNSRMIGIVQGLAVGDTSRMQHDQWRVFANTGTTHLMAISGMHIGMVALLMSFLAGRVARRLPLQRTRVSAIAIESSVGLCAGIIYSALAGMSVPTQRTLIMLSVYFIARLVRRELPVSHGLALALILVLLVDPIAPLAPGFWLSFGAVAALFLAGAGRVGLHSKLREYFRTQTAVTVGLAPLLIGAFGNLSMISPLVNLVAIPFFTLLVVPLILFATCVLTLNTSLGVVLLYGVDSLLVWTWPALEWASRLPLATWPFPHAPIWAFTLLVLGAFILIAPGIAATRIAGAMLCLPALTWQPIKPSIGAFELTLLDVGQGLAVAIRTSSHVLVYDTGPNFRSGRDTGELVLVPFLHAFGIRQLDAVVISHGDADHVGGLQSLLAAIPARRVLLGPSVQPIGKSERCASDQRWKWDGVEFSMLHPIDDRTAPNDLRGKRRNDSSCVLRIQGSGGSVLLVGDIEARAERELIETRASLRSDIVVVPHHGSRTSSSPDFVAATAPDYALIGVGFGNRFGFPKTEVVARWRDAGAHLLQTDVSGAIQILVSSQAVGQAQEYRQIERRYWRQ